MNMSTVYWALEIVNLFFYLLLSFPSLLFPFLSSLFVPFPIFTSPSLVRFVRALPMWYCCRHIFIRLIQPKAHSIVTTKCCVRRKQIRIRLIAKQQYTVRMARLSTNSVGSNGGKVKLTHHLRGKRIHWILCKTTAQINSRKECTNCPLSCWLSLLQLF